MSPSGLVLAAGGMSFVGNWREEGGFPDKGYTIIAATLALVFLASFANGSLEKPVKAAAGVMLLAACIRYIPAFNSKTTKKGKTNG